MTLATRYILTGVAGCTSALGFAFPFVWPFILIGLSVFFFIIWFLTRSALESLVHGFIFGIITAGIIIALFLATLPIEWFAEDQSSQILSLVLLWTLVSSALAFGTALVTPFLFFARTLPVKAAILPLLGGIIWTIQEYVRMLLFSFITLGEGSLPGAHFSITAFGHAFTEHLYFLQFAEFFGIYSLSFAVAVFAGCCAVVAYALSKKQKSATILTLLLGVFLLATPTLIKSSPNLPSPLSVAVVTLNSSPEPRNDFFNEVLTEVTKQPIDVVIFPESIIPPWFANTKTREELHERLKDRSILFIYSRYQIDSEKPGQAELVYEYLDGRTITYQKRFLMPLSEYIPAFAGVMFTPFVNTHIKQQAESSVKLIARGEVSAPVVTQNHISIGALLCSETLSPVLYDELARKNAQILVNLSTTAWFTDSKRVTRLLTSIATIHAVQHRSYFILASKGGSSAIIAPSGKIIAQSKHNSNSVLIQKLPSLY